MPRYTFLCTNCYWLNERWVSMDKYDEYKTNDWKDLKSCDQCGGTDFERNFKMGFATIRTQVGKQDAYEIAKRQRRRLAQRVDKESEKTESIRKKVTEGMKNLKRRQKAESDKGRKKDLRNKYKESMLDPFHKQKQKEIQEKYDKKAKEKIKKKKRKQ